MTLVILPNQLFNNIPEELVNEFLQELVQL